MNGYRGIMLSSALRVVAVWLAVMSAQGGDTASNPGLAKSDDVAGLRVLVFSASPGPIPSQNDGLCYSFQSTNRDPVTVLVPTDLETLCRIEMVDDTGSPVKRTVLGRKTGSRFQTAPIKPNIKQVRRTVTVGNSLLPAPSQLFEIQRPGKYSLKIQFQLYYNADSKGAKLVRLPVVVYFVTVPKKPAD